MTVKVSAFCSQNFILQTWGYQNKFMAYNGTFELQIWKFNLLCFESQVYQFSISAKN